MYIHSNIIRCLWFLELIVYTITFTTLVFGSLNRLFEADQLHTNIFGGESLYQKKCSRKL